MKVKFLKKHLKFNAGDTVDVEEAKANYWVSTKVAEVVGNTKTEKHSAAALALHNVERVAQDSPFVFIEHKEEKVVKPAKKETKVIKKAAKKR